MVINQGSGLGQEGSMKVLLLSDELFELAKKKIQQEYDCAQTAVCMAKAWERMYNLHYYNMARLRKRRLEAHRLLREIKRHGLDQKPTNP